MRNKPLNKRSKPSKPTIYLVQFHKVILVDWSARGEFGRFGEKSESELMFGHLWDDTAHDCPMDYLDWIKRLANAHGWEVSLRVPSKKEMWERTDIF